MALGTRSDPWGSAVSQGHALGHAYDVPRRRLVAPATPHRLGLSLILDLLVSVA